MQNDDRGPSRGDHTAVRLRGGRNPYEGRVEIEQDGTWVPVCGDGFDLKVGAVVCRHLNFGYAYHAFSMSSALDESASFEFAGPDDNVIRMECPSGAGKVLSDCQTTLSTVRACSPHQANWASVICTQCKCLIFFATNR
jgi:hypothetical protein